MQDEISELWDYLLDNGIATTDELTLVTYINGYTIEALNDILYVRTGYQARNDDD